MKDTRNLFKNTLTAAGLLLWSWPAQAVGWINTGWMTTARHYHTATLLPNGKVLVVGGSDGTTLDESPRPSTFRQSAVFFWNGVACSGQWTKLKFLGCENEPKHTTGHIMKLKRNKNEHRT